MVTNAKIDENIFVDVKAIEGVLHEFKGCVCMNWVLRILQEVKNGTDTMEKPRV
jgi:hypothetical protein